MVNIIYLVNGLSKTSIPWRWSSFFNKHSKNYYVSLLEIKKIFNLSSDVKIVHGHHIKAMFIFLVLNSFFRKKSVYTVHGSYLFLSKSNTKLLKYIFIKSDKVIFVNKQLYDVLPMEMKKIIQNKHEIILNGVETDYNYVDSNVYNKFQINKEDIILFHPARFVTEKNHIKILSALKILIKYNNKIKLVLAGDGKLKEEITTYISDNNLEDNVYMLGLIERDEVYSFLKRCDIFLMPSISEGLNIAFLEAISMNCRILVSNIEQFTYPIESYNLNPIDLNIMFVNPLDEEEIAQTISLLLKQEKNLS